MQEQAPHEQTLSIREAAQYFGLGETTIRRRIHSGELRAFKLVTPYGLEWRVVIPTQHGGGASAVGGEVAASGGGPTTDEGTVQRLHEHVTAEVQQVEDGGEGSTTGGEGSGSAPSDRVALALVEENRRLQDQALHLAGRIGWLEAQLQQAQEQVRMLTDAQHAPEQPAQPEPTPQPAEHPPPKRLPWWKRLFAEI